MFPDLVLAVEEEEPELAGNFFTTVKQWVSDLKESVRATQIANKASMDQVKLARCSVIQYYYRTLTFAIDSRHSGKVYIRPKQEQERESNHKISYAQELFRCSHGKTENKKDFSSPHDWK